MFKKRLALDYGGPLDSHHHHMGRPATLMESCVRRTARANYKKKETKN